MDTIEYQKTIEKIIDERANFKRYHEEYKDESKYRLIYIYQSLDRNTNIINDLYNVLIRVKCFCALSLLQLTDPDTYISYIYIELAHTHLIQDAALKNNFQPII
jgi:hypothetical protein